MLTPGGGKGGTSTTGPQGRRFFSDQENIINVISELCTDRHRESLLLLHKQLSVIMRVVTSKRKVDMEKYSQIIYDFNMNVTQNFPWVVLCHTLHATIHHSEELMKDNGE